MRVLTLLRRCLDRTAVQSVEIADSNFANETTCCKFFVLFNSIDNRKQTARAGAKVKPE